MSDFIKFKGKFININNINYIDQSHNAGSSQLTIYMVGEKIKFPYSEADERELKELISKQ